MRRGGVPNARVHPTGSSGPAGSPSLPDRSVDRTGPEISKEERFARAIAEVAAGGSIAEMARLCNLNPEALRSRVRRAATARPAMRSEQPTAPTDGSNEPAMAGQPAAGAPATPQVDGVAAGPLPPDLAGERLAVGQPATARPTDATTPTNGASAEPGIPDGAQVGSLVAPLALRLSALESWAAGRSAARDLEFDVDALADGQELVERELTRIVEQLGKLRGDLAELADATHATGDLLVRLVAFVRWRVHAGSEQPREPVPGGQ